MWHGPSNLLCNSQSLPEHHSYNPDGVGEDSEASRTQDNLRDRLKEGRPAGNMPSINEVHSPSGESLSLGCDRQRINNHAETNGTELVTASAPYPSAGGLHSILSYPWLMSCPQQEPDALKLAREIARHLPTRASVAVLWNSSGPCPPSNGPAHSYDTCVSGHMPERARPQEEVQQVREQQPEINMNNMTCHEASGSSKTGEVPCMIHVPSTVLPCYSMINLC